MTVLGIKELCATIGQCENDLEHIYANNELESSEDYEALSLARDTLAEARSVINALLDTVNVF